MALQEWIDEDNMARKTQTDSDFQNGDITLREYIEAILKEKDKANVLAAQVLDERLERMNEFREQITKERGSFVNRDAYDIRCSQVDDKLNSLERQFANMDGRWLASTTVMVIAIAGVAVGMTALVFLHG